MSQPASLEPLLADALIKFLLAVEYVICNVSVMIGRYAQF